MEANLKDVGDTKKELEATLTYEELQPHFEEALANYRKKANIPGFRKGKAPLNMIKKLYGDSLEYSALENIAEKTLQNYIKENKIRMAGIASLTDMDYKPKEKMTFKVEFEYFPEIVIENYKGLDLTNTKYIIKDDAIEDEIHHLLFDRATKEIDGQVFDKDYTVTVDVNEVDEAGNIIVGTTEKDVSIYVGDEHLDKNLFKALQGIKEGEEKRVQMKSKDYKMVNYLVKANKIEKLVYPEINEEFLKRITGKDEVKTREDLKDFFKKQMESSYETHSRNELEQNLITEIIRINDCKLPDAFVDNVLSNEFEESKKENPQYAQYLKEEDFKNKRKSDTVFYLKWHMIKDKIFELENIEVTDEDIAKLAEKNAKMYNIPADKLVELYKGRKEILEKAKENKLIDFILENSNVSEVEKEIGAHKH